MDSLELEPLYAEIGQMIAVDVRAQPEGALLYAEVEEGMIACSIFKDLGTRVIYRECSDQLMDKLYEIWGMEHRDKRWSSISYSILPGRFEASFEFPDKFATDEDFDDRRARFVTRKFGDKSVDYSDP